MATSRYYARLAAVGLLVLIGVLVATSIAQAAVSISRAELSGTNLRLEGQASPNRTITVDGVAMGTSDGGGKFRIDRSGFTAPADCTVDVNDGSATAATARLSGCTVTSSPTTPTLSSLSLSPTSVVGGSSSTGTVTLTSAAPSAGQTVTLASSNSSVAAVPPSVNVTGGSTSATFTITTGAVTSSSSATITATGGGVSRSSVLTVTTGATSSSLSSLTVSPTDVVGPDPATGTVTLSSAAPSGGFTVDLTSNNTAAATVPPSVTVPAGSTRATFTVSTKELTNAQSATIIGTVGGNFSTERHSTITVWDPFHFSNGSIAILPGGTGSGRVTSQPAGIDCTIVRGNGTDAGPCTAFFPVGTVVRLDARAAADSKFVGWNTDLPGCFDPSKVTVARGTTITCQVGFVPR